MIATEEPNSGCVVSRADNRRKLEDICAEVEETLHSLDRIEDEGSSLSARIILAGVQMIDIRHADPVTWGAFTEAQPAAARIRCKGKGREFREVTNVLWRRHHSGAPSRERTSLYAKAINVAHQQWKQMDPADTAKLLTWIVSSGGVTGLARRVPPRDRSLSSKKIFIDVPQCPTLYLVRPDSTYAALEPEVNRKFLSELERFQL